MFTINSCCSGNNAITNAGNMPETSRNTVTATNGYEVSQHSLRREQIIPPNTADKLLAKANGLTLCMVKNNLHIPENALDNHQVAQECQQWLVERIKNEYSPENNAIFMLGSPLNTPTSSAALSLPVSRSALTQEIAGAENKLRANEQNQPAAASNGYVMQHFPS